MNIHCSVKERFGVSTIDPSAVSTPIVAKMCRALQKPWRMGRNGKLVEDRNRGQIAESIRNIMDQCPGPWVSSSIGSARKYSCDKTAFMWEEDLKAICE